eukprot:1136233-Pelagomonas_calceolata.AAC.5
MTASATIDVASHATRVHELTGSCVQKVLVSGFDSLDEVDPAITNLQAAGRVPHHHGAMQACATCAIAQLAPSSQGTASSSSETIHS